MKDNQIKGPSKSSYINVYLSENPITVYGEYIDNNDKDDANYYLNYKNYLLLHKFITTIKNVSSFTIKDNKQYIREIRIDLDNHDETFKTGYHENNNYQFMFNNQEIDVKYSPEVNEGLYVSSDYLEKFLKPFSIVSYGTIIQYDLSKRNIIINLLKENNYQYINNDSIEKNLQSSEMLFMNETLFIACSLVPFVLLILITNKSLYSLLKSRKNELLLLRKIGFSKKTIIKSVLVLLVFTLIVSIIFCLIYSLIFRFTLNDLFILMLFEEIIFSYLLIKNLIQKTELLMKEKE